MTFPGRIVRSRAPSSSTAGPGFPGSTLDPPSKGVLARRGPSTESGEALPRASTATPVPRFLPDASPGRGSWGCRAPAPSPALLGARSAPYPGAGRPTRGPHLSSSAHPQGAAARDAADTQRRPAERAPRGGGRACSLSAPPARAAREESGAGETVASVASPTSGRRLFKGPGRSHLPAFVAGRGAAGFTPDLHVKVQMSILHVKGDVNPFPRGNWRIRFKELENIPTLGLGESSVWSQRAHE